MGGGPKGGRTPTRQGVKCYCGHWPPPSRTDLSSLQPESCRLLPPVALGPALRHSTAGDSQGFAEALAAPSSQCPRY